MKTRQKRLPAMWRRKRINVQVYPKWRARKLQFDLVNIIFYVNLYLFNFFPLTSFLRDIIFL